ncbi:hypothetical protein GCM10009736_20910 [Actinomadura bangladeshensis]
MRGAGGTRNALDGAGGAPQATPAAESGCRGGVGKVVSAGPAPVDGGCGVPGGGAVHASSGDAGDGADVAWGWAGGGGGGVGVPGVGCGAMGAGAVHASGGGGGAASGGGGGSGGGVVLRDVRRRVRDS